MWHAIHHGILIIDSGLSRHAAINWGSSLATVLVLLLVGALVGAMIFVIKLTTDDSDKHKQIKEFVETLFGTPAHLRQGGGSEESGKDLDTVKARSSAEPFHEPCPACDTTVTHDDIHCPSCGLRLQ
ncbi:zinc ribbon domain-containing protein [Paenibacillus spongiae]|uniref:Zinc ribbon domain-containing protein n=1 Tax=Paenibacillus spongiae TaxID=2909671 RepID=A0ABY5SA86_9BACL|nr:zinc ribbon domain-containing protein [Paenibacillus spongiae]UVI30851.1 zinc ribbon domain-containing protein [Paenibacillus spongiae]